MFGKYPIWGPCHTQSPHFHLYYLQNIFHYGYWIALCHPFDWHNLDLSIPILNNTRMLIRFMDCQYMGQRWSISFEILEAVFSVDWTKTISSNIQRRLTFSLTDTLFQNMLKTRWKDRKHMNMPKTFSLCCSFSINPSPVFITWSAVSPPSFPSYIFS